MRSRDTRGRFRNKPNPEVTDIANLFGGRQGSATTFADRYKNKNGETSTQKALETEIGALAEETVEQDIGSGVDQPNIGEGGP